MARRTFTREFKISAVRLVYDSYRELSRQYGVEPFSYVYFYANLGYLQSIGLIMLASTKVGRAYTNRIEPLFDTALLKMTVAARLA